MSDLRVALISRPEVAPAFALAGFRPLAVADAQDAGRRLTALLSDARVGLVLIEGPLYDGLDQRAVHPQDAQGTHRSRTW